MWESLLQDDSADGNQATGGSSSTFRHFLGECGCVTKIIHVTEYLQDFPVCLGVHLPAAKATYQDVSWPEQRVIEG